MINTILKWINLISATLAVLVFYFDDTIERNWYGISAIINFMLFKYLSENERSKHNSTKSLRNEKELQKTDV